HAERSNRRGSPPLYARHNLLHPTQPRQFIRNTLCSAMSIARGASAKVERVVLNALAITSSAADICALADPPLEKQQAPLFQFFVGLSEGVHGKLQIFARMRGGYLRANTRGAMWNDRIEEPDDINAFLQHARGELLRFRRVADHDRDDRMHTGFDR